MYKQFESEDILDKDIKAIINKLNKNKARLLAEALRLDTRDMDFITNNTRLLDKIDRVERTTKFLNGYN